MDVMNEYDYKDYKTGVFYPLVEMKFINKGTRPVNEFMYDLPNGRVAADERFLFADDRIVNNIIFQRYLISNYGRIFDRLKGEFMNPVINRPVTGYYKVKFSYYKSPTEIAAKDVYIHRAVLLMFNYFPGAEYPSQCGLQVNHINGNHADNRLCNLEWLTQYDNNMHAINTGLRGTMLIDNNYNVNDPRQPVRIVCSLLQDGFSNKEITEKTGVPNYIISEIRAGKAYKAFSQEYNIPKFSRSKANDELVMKICEMICHGYKNTQIAEALGVKRQMVSEIRLRRNYTYISNNYVW